MIATHQLYAWKCKIEDTKHKALDLAKEHSANGDVSAYYMHLVNVSDAQLSLIDRLIMYSEEQDKEKEV